MATKSVIWRKSTQCGGSATCVEVGVLEDGLIGTRDTKDGTNGPVLRFEAKTWRSFITNIKSGDFDL
ncbi:DUF397 domain-containing protein [Actinomadura barringtoniae]|uniref:DUF397 domain-containing protein n=1 Tax=Actinomadura barringtoniae TaxID=1427535 RepID=A0A939PPA8_9ACTN|nr:DUF397 domain-containing protein [Actinomadura barringtoniae]MBO2452236.1 DUF397 domain-containing protein [Actinomadura barringtoniae]